MVVNNVESCPEDRCKNGGNCTYATVNNEFIVVGCDCPKGFTGPTCENGRRIYDNLAQISLQYNSEATY